MGIFGYSKVVAFDLETTGLDSVYDEIIEIGAVKFFENGRIEKFNSLVSTDRPIPFFVSQLTGIDNEMILDAPGIDKVLPNFLDFVGDAPLIAHNADFDLSFIREAARKLGIKSLRNRIFDTLLIARLLYPNCLNHQLETLSLLFNFKMDNQHRALDDAEACLAIAQGLWQRTLSLRLEMFQTLEELIFATGNFDLEFYWGRAREVRSNFEKVPDPPEINEKILLKLQNSFGKPTRGKIDFSPEIVSKYFLTDGLLSEKVSGFRFRPQQSDMAETVTYAMINGELLMIEAGTGVGKSFAYLVPAVYWAVSNGEKVVISTYTKALQEQLFNKDIPTIAECVPFDFNVLLLKGKGNYLCLYRLERFIKDPVLLPISERKALLYLVSWAMETESGDIAENSSFNIFFQTSLWEKIRADGHTCVGKKCPFYADCFVYKVRRKVQDAQLLIVNHALLLSDIEGAILGDYETLIIDEAHNLDKVAADYLGGAIAVWRFRSVLDGIYTESPIPSGTLNYLMSEIETPELQGLYDDTKEAISKARDFVESFFSELTLSIENLYHWKNRRYSVRKRYDFVNPVFRAVEQSALKLYDLLKAAHINLDKFIIKTGQPKGEKIERLFEELKGEKSRLVEIMDDLLMVLNPEDPEIVYWLTSPSNENSVDSRLCWSPLDVGQILNNALYEKLNSVIFTSATLAVTSDFNYYIERLGLSYSQIDRVRTVLLGSPYDYDTQLKIIVAAYMPDPKDYNRFLKCIGDIVLETSKKFRKGTMVLFTSHDALRQVYKDLYNNFKLERLKLLGQGLTGSMSGISRQFIDNEESVLLGTESFWQGVDIPGKSLEVLMIMKLPFAVPNDPYVEAMCEDFQRHGRNSFEEYIIPQAVIRFRQGVGRLIRSETDKGVLVILDKRIVKARYGGKFLRSLPTKTVTIENVDLLLDIVSDHLS